MFKLFFPNSNSLQQFIQSITNDSDDAYRSMLVVKENTSSTTIKCSKYGSKYIKKFVRVKGKDKWRMTHDQGHRHMQRSAVTPGTNIRWIQQQQEPD